MGVISLTYDQSYVEFSQILAPARSEVCCLSNGHSSDDSIHLISDAVLAQAATSSSNRRSDGVL